MMSDLSTVFNDTLKSIMYNAAMVQRIPLLLVCAAGFYLIAVVIVLGLFHKGARQRIRSLFSLPAPTSGNAMPPLDAFRGLAIIGVASYHSWQWFTPLNSGMYEYDLFTFIKQGYKGLLLFVVLSGFLVYRTVKNRLFTVDDLAYYAKRRFLRIYPVYFVSIVALLLLGLIGRNPSVLQNFIASVFMYYSYKYPSLANTAVWSLYVEVVFYICLPYWVIATKRFPLASALMALFILSLTGGITSNIPGELQIVRYFFMGIVAAEVLERYAINQGTAALLLAAGLGLLAVDFVTDDIASALLANASSYLGLTLALDTSIYNSITLMVALALILIGVITFAPAYRVLSFYPLRFIGIISYSIFIWHGVILLWIGRVLNRAPSLSYRGDTVTLLGVYWPAYLFVAMLSYVFIEKPLQRWRVRSSGSGRSSQPGPECAVPADGEGRGRG